MSDLLPGIFSPFADDKVRVNPDIVVDNSTIAGEDTSDPFLRDTLIPVGGAFFRPEEDLGKDSHGLNKLQLAASDPQAKHGPCFQLLELKTPEARQAVRQAGHEVEEITLSFRGQEVTSYFVRVPLLTKTQLLDELAKKPRTEAERQCVSMGVKPEELIERLPYQGRAGLILASKAQKWTGTKLDELSPSEIEDLFQVLEQWRLYRHHQEELQSLARDLKMTIPTLQETVERIRTANTLRAEFLELSENVPDIQDSKEGKEEEVLPRFPRPREFHFSEDFKVFDTYEQFSAQWAEDKNVIPSLATLRSVLPKAVSRKVKWPDNIQGPREFWNVVCDAFEALEAWDNKRFLDWEARCSDGWETLGMVASAIPGGFFGDSEDEESGEVDSPMTYFQSDEPEIRPRQGLLNQPLAETDEELVVGDLHLRIKASVTTPKPRLAFMGDSGPGAAEVPWTRMNEADKPGLPTKFRGHPLAFYLNALMEMASQPRDPVAMKLIEEPFEPKRVTIAELLYGRHEGYHATRSLRVEIKRLEERAQHLDFLLRLAKGWTDFEMLVAMWNLAKVFGQPQLKFNPNVSPSDLQGELDEVLNELVACEQLLKGQALLEAEWFLAVVLKQRTFNQIVPQRLRLSNKRFTTVQAHLVNPVYKWNRKAKSPELISGEYWVPTQSVLPLKEGDEFRTRITVHSYPVNKETGYTVSLWYVRNNKIVIPNPKDPLLEQYGPKGLTPSMNIHFRSRFEAEVERFGLRMTPWLDEFYRIGYRLVRDVFPDAVRWAQALCDDWHEGVEGLTEVDDKFASIDHRGRPIRTQVRFSKPEDQEDVIEVHTDREDLSLAMWNELRRFQDDALDKAIEANTRHHLTEITAEMKEAYARISVNPEWAWRKNQESGWGFQERVLKAGGHLDRALARVREYPVLPGLGEREEWLTTDTHWRAFGYLGCDRPPSFIGTMVADRLLHANPGLPGFRLTDDGKRWQRPTAFEPWRFSEGPLGRLKNAIYAISYPKAGLEFLTPSLEAVRGSSLEAATYAHVSEQVDAFLGAELPGHVTLKRKQLIRQIVGLIGLPTYGETDEISRLIQVTNLLGGDGQPQSELEQLTRQLWTQDPKARNEILEGLLSKDGRRIYGLRLWPMLRDFGVLREGKVRPDPSCNQLSFCQPYVRSPAERLAW